MTKVRPHIYAALAVTNGVALNNAAPMSIQLRRNYSDPFYLATMINYQLPATEIVQLHVYDLPGKEVAVSVNEVQNGDDHQPTFDVHELFSEMYFYKLHREISPK